MLTKTETVARRPTADRGILDFFFSPKTVAVIGASEKPDSVGRTLLWNLISSPFGGTVYPVNSKRHSVLGIKAYARAADIPEPVELAIIATPAVTVPGIIRECGEAGAKGAIIISAGFREAGPEGTRLEEEVLAEARAAGIRLIGSELSGRDAPGASDSTPPSPPPWPAPATSVSSARAALSAPPCSTGAARRMVGLQRASSPSARCWTWAGAT